MKSRILPKNPYSYYGDKGPLIGKGSFGRVYKYPNDIAIKKIKIGDEYDELGITGETIIEIALLNSLDHPHIILLKDVIYKGNSLGIVMNNAQYGIIVAYDWTFGERKELCYQVISAISYLHSLSIIHRDIKPTNILVFDGPIKTAKLADFGSALPLSCLKEYCTDHRVYTIGFQAPEILFISKYNISADIWALGATLYYIFVGRRFLPVNKESDSIPELLSIMGTPKGPLKTLYNIQEDNYHEFPNYNDRIEDNQLRNLLDKIFKYDPRDRPTIFEISNDPFFYSIKTKPPISSNNNCKKVLDDYSVPYPPSTRIPQINNKHLIILFGWMIDVCNSDKYINNARILHCSIRILDDYLYRIGNAAQFNLLQLYGMSAIALASKINTQKSLTLGGWRELSDNQYTIDQIKDNQIDMLITINGQVVFTVPEDYRTIDGKLGNKYLLLFISLTNLRFEYTAEGIYDLHLRLLKKDEPTVSDIISSNKILFNKINKYSIKVDKVDLRTLLDIS